jgi:hypothetical protein
MGLIPEGAAMRRGEGGGKGTNTVTAAKMRRREGGGIGTVVAAAKRTPFASGLRTDAVAAARRTPFASGLRVRLTRGEECTAIAAVSPLVLTMVVETSIRQDPGYRRSQVSAAADTVNSAQQQVVAATTGASFIGGLRKSTEGSVQSCAVAKW